MAKLHFKRGDRGGLVIDGANDLPEPDRWMKYKKVGFTAAIRIREPFVCETVEGNVVECKDGYLCIDDRGFPYPCDPQVFEATYQPLTNEEIAELL